MSDESTVWRYVWTAISVGFTIFTTCLVLNVLLAGAIMVGAMIYDKLVQQRQQEQLKDVRPEVKQP